MRPELLISSPLGNITLSASPTGITLCQFENAESKERDEERPSSLGAADHEAAQQILWRAQSALERYFAGEHKALNELPVDAAGTIFQRRVWSATRLIMPGTTMTYGALARQLGDSKAARAVGLALHRNPIALIIPCHRVVGKNNSLQGYAGGVDRKEYLLRMEGALP